MKKLALIFIFIPIISFSQRGNSYTNGAIELSTGNINSLNTGADAIFTNTAGVANQLNRTGAIINFQNKFGVNALNNLGLGGFYTIGKSTIIGGLHHFGISEFKEQSFFLGYARPLSDNFYVGCDFNFNNIFIREFGNKSLFGATLSLQSKITKQLTLASSFKNILMTKTANFNPPSEINIGLKYSPSSKADLLMEFSKINERPLSPKLALLYRPVDKLEIRFGTDIGTNQYGLGMSFKLSRVKILTAYQAHTNLGGSYGLTGQI